MHLIYSVNKKLIANFREKTFLAFQIPNGFFGFLEYGKPWKIASEINWPLEGQKYKCDSKKPLLPLHIVHNVQIYNNEIMRRKLFKS